MVKQAKVSHDLESAETGKAVRLDHKRKSVRPSLRQSIRRPMHRKPLLIHARPES